MQFFQQDVPYPFSLLRTAERCSDELYVLELGISSPPAGRSIGPRIRESYLLHFLTRGSGAFNGEPLYAGQGFLICPGQPHRFSAAMPEGFSHFWLAFDGPQVQPLLRQAGFPTAEPCIFEFSQPQSAEEHLHALLKTEEPLSALRLTGELYYALSLCQRNAVPPLDLSPRGYARRVLELIHLHYDTPIRITELARAVGISPKYLCRVFHAETGCSPKEYLTRLRMDRADMLLCDTSLPVQAVAQSVGYDNALDFSQIYRKYRGSSPSAVRRGPADET